MRIKLNIEAILNQEAIGLNSQEVCLVDISPIKTKGI